MPNIIKLDHPVRDWEKGLPIGNGRLGAMITGQAADESILINEETMYYGDPKDRYNPDTRQGVGKLRSLLKAGKVEEAAFYASAVLSGTPRYLSPFQPASFLRIFHYNQKGTVSDYTRALDIDNAIASVAFTINAVQYKREYFASLDTNVLAVKLSADAPFSLIASLTRRPFEEHTGKIANDTVGIWGRNGGGGGGASAVAYFGASRLIASGGKFEALGDDLTVKQADSVVIYTAFQTDYRGNSGYRENVLESLREAVQTGYDRLKEKHIAKYHELYDRVELSINNAQVSEEPTDALLEKLRNGGESDYLTLLEFNLGRYLLISSSYNCRLPANLQGLWNGSYTPPWESVFTININLQMNYWPAEVCALPECTAPLFNLIELLAERGKVTAQRLYGAKGFVAHHNTDMWGDTDPVGILSASPFWVMGGAWLALHLYEHYQYTQDRDFLKNRAFPVIEEALVFFLDYTVEDGNGVLHTGPSVSPENTYITKDGQMASLCMSPTMDIQILRELCGCYEAICGILDIRSETREKIAEMARRLPETRLTKDGRIREWLEDYEEAEPGHRHISHLFALHPGSQITEKTPELLEAAKKTLEGRLSHGGGHTGWSCAWIINFFARLKNGNAAYQYVRQLLSGKTAENMLNIHPPFQIDGNFGFTAAVAEMLVQSHAACYELLPALPDAWKTGHVKGLRLRGGVTAELFWDNGKLTKAVLTADRDMRGKVKYGNSAAEVDLRANTPYTYKS